MKTLLKETKFTWSIIVLHILTWLCTLPFLRKEIPMQYSSNGDVNWSTHKVLAALFMIGLAIVIYFISNIKLLKDHKQRAYSHTYRLNSLLNSIIQLFVYIISLMMILKAFGYNISPQFVTPIIVGILLIVVGNYLPKVPKNNTVGISNKWTRSSEMIWKKTHRFTSRVYLICGVILILLSIFHLINTTATIILIIILVLIPALYSFIKYRSIAEN
ncbi:MULTISPECIES: SdpI family protein [Staphylococcus]|uniref:SdpI family protein n=1 Tax=Staphylococcus hsinchuensis TaxID=3051183 RepID=A0ABZ3EDZ4_9STAP|nr:MULTISPECIES: SdpI family protein [unclassified Staphylococcus]